MDDAPATEQGEPFARWLEAELRARRLSRRGLARRSGVDHSTIVRLRQGQRDPSLATATRIARALGSPAGRVTLADGQPVRPVERVKAALQADPALGEMEVAAVMRLYLGVRTRPPSPGAG